MPVPAGVLPDLVACLLTADAVVDDDRGQGDAAEVGQCVLVVAGGDAAPLFEPVEAAFDGVAVAVGLGVEGGWAPSSGISMGLSPACPGESSIVTGAHSSSVRAWILVVHPPRERPSA